MAVGPTSVYDVYNPCASAYLGSSQYASNTASCWCAWEAVDGNSSIAVWTIHVGNLDGVLALDFKLAKFCLTAI